jgi:hypothetical protein
MADFSAFPAMAVSLYVPLRQGTHTREDQIEQRAEMPWLTESMGPRFPVARDPPRAHRKYRHDGAVSRMLLPAA